MSLALVASIFTIIQAAPAGAEPPTSVASLLPNASHPETAQMSDAPDGVTTMPGAHFSALADPGATQVSWYSCAEGSADETNTPTGCTLLGTDDSGIQTEGDGEEGYELLKEFNAALQGDWDVVVQACEGSAGADGADAGTLADNCVQDVESGVRFDDGDTGGREFVTGEAPATCEQNSCISPPSYVTPFVNGEVTHNATGGAAIYTSFDGDEVGACFDLDVDSTLEEFTCDEYSTGSLFPFESDPNEVWRRGATFVDFPDDSNWAMLIIATSDTPDNGCAGAEVIADHPEMDASAGCVVAINYGRSTDDDPAQTIGSFLTDDNTCKDVGEANARVGSEADEYEVLLATDTRDMVGCVLEPAADLYRGDVQATWESDGPGELTDCAGTASDNDADGLDDRCVIAAGDAELLYSAGIANSAAEEGEQTLTFCVDPGGNGCADDPVYDTLTAVWLGEGPATQCSDGLDNDGDGDVDLADAGCTDLLDDSEDSDQPLEVASKITAKYKAGAFKGKVSSDDPDCVGGRKVTVKKGKKKKGTTTTTATGAWKIKKAAPKGKYTATVAARTVDGTLCLSAKKSFQRK